ncbi:MAG: MBL fold metallo-hydrolase [Clostridia bacterium]|nr:MBL fold metallo-hydrolase [Clostridia bacterium]
MRRWVILLSFVLLLCTGCATDPPDISAPESVPASENTLPQGTVRLCAFNVGKADCLLLTAGDHHLLIDTGENETDAQVVQWLKKRGVSHIDLLLLTHNDKDHIGGAETILQQFSVGRIVQADYDEESNRYQRYVAAANAAGLSRERLTKETIFSVGGAVIRLIPAAGTGYDSDNDYSILTEVTVGARRLLLTGDAEKNRLAEFLDTQPAGRYDVIKLPHHGSWNGSTKKFLKAFCGSDVIISTSLEQEPEEKLTNWLTNNDRKAWYTYNGTVTVETDGTSLTITQEQE